jgi:hypothetical protein
MTAAMLRLPLSAVLLTTLFLGSDGFPVMPLTIVAVVVAYVTANWLTPPAAASATTAQAAAPPEPVAADTDEPAPRTPLRGGGAPVGGSGHPTGDPREDGPKLPQSG